MGVDVEVEGAMDSDTARLDPGDSVVVLQVDPLQLEEIPLSQMYEEIIMEVEGPAEAEQPLQTQEGEVPQTSSAEMQRRRCSVRVKDETAARVKRNQQFLEQSREIHDKKLEEQSKKSELVDLQIELVRMQTEHEKNMEERDAQLHELKMKKCRLEIEQLEASPK